MGNYKYSQRDKQHDDDRESDRCDRLQRGASGELSCTQLGIQRQRRLTWVIANVAPKLSSSTSVNVMMRDLRTLFSDSLGDVARRSLMR